MAGILSKQHIIAKPGFNRWLIVPAALGIHLCIGSVYAWEHLQSRPGKTARGSGERRR